MGIQGATLLTSRPDQELADLVAHFSVADADHLAGRFDDAFRRIAQHLGADRIAFVTLSATNATVSRNFQFPPPSEATHEAADSIATMPAYVAELVAGRPVSFTHGDRLPDAAGAEREIAQSLGVRAHLAVPVVGAHGTAYALTVSSGSDRPAWDEAATAWLHILAAMLAAAVERAQAEQEHAAALRFERVLADAASALAALDTQDLVGPFVEVLRQIVLQLGCDRANVSELSADGRAFVPVASWARPGVPPHDFPIDADHYPRYWGELAAGRMLRLVHIPDEFPPGTEAERELATRIGIKSHVSIPMASGNTVIGFVGLGSMARYVDWPESILNRLRVLAGVFGSAIVRARTRRQVAALAERLEAENIVLRTEIGHERGFEQIVGKSATLQRTLSLVAQVAPTDVTVLVTGETGTGKELIARAVHARSSRRDRPLLALNCAALPPGLVESELFGHEQGAFTGALTRKIGRFEVADRGTIFLDEIGDLPPDLQAKLLRVLQEGAFERVGSTVTRKVDVRVIAATNQDLERAVAERRFRSDLYYRLSVFPIPVPPLRERIEDIPLLVWYFVHARQAALRRSFTQVSSRLLRAFDQYSWPGNVRELQHVLERAMILSTGPTLRLDEFGRQHEGPGAAPTALDDVERAHITRVLEACGWRINGDGNAAARLGLHPSTLRFRMKRLGVARPGARRDG